MNLRTLLMGAAAALTLGIAAQPANATIVIANSSSGCGGCSTVHLLDNVLGDNVVDGWITNSPGILVQFTSDEAIEATSPGQGQAWVGGVDGSTEDLTFRLLGGHTFDMAEFNLNTASGAPSAWYVTINGVDQFNQTYSQNFAFDTNGNMGNQFFDLSILAGSGEHITSIGFTVTDANFDPINPSPIIAAGQFRVGGIDGAIPEPASWALMLTGFGGIGALLRRRRALAVA